MTKKAKVESFWISFWAVKSCVLIKFKARFVSKNKVLWTSDKDFLTYAGKVDKGCIKSVPQSKKPEFQTKADRPAVKITDPGGLKTQLPLSSSPRGAYAAG